MNLRKKRKYYLKSHLVDSEFESKLFAFLSFVPLAVISSVRYEVGTDYIAYKYIFLNGAKAYANIEPLFTGFVQIINKLSTEPQMFFAVSSLFICGCYFKCIYDNSEDPAFSIFLFVAVQEYFRSMNIVRQYLATAIILLSFHALEQKRWKQTLLLIIIAGFMHNSAFVGLLIFFIYWIDLKPVVMLLITIVTFFLCGAIRVFLYPLINNYTHFGGYFRNTSQYSQSVFGVGGFLILFCFFLLITYIYYFEKTKMDEKLKMLLSGVFLGLIISVLGLSFPNLIDRLGLYADPFIVTYGPSIVRAIKNEDLKGVAKWTIIIGYTSIAITSIAGGRHGVIPYIAFWQ